MKKTIIYIDGFNLYYSLKKTAFKWLNLQKLSSVCLDPHKHEIVNIKYFTARVKGQLKDPSNTTRQNIYLRALRTIQNLEIIFGRFKERQVKGFLCHDKSKTPIRPKKLVTISKWEEKESDVNVATHLIADGYQNKYECAVLISNDTDLISPLLHIKNNLKKFVIVISPHKSIHKDLKKLAHFSKTISPETLKKCQFPNKLKDSNGEFLCPTKWKQKSK